MESGGLLNIGMTERSPAAISLWPPPTAFTKNTRLPIVVSVTPSVMFGAKHK